MTIGDGARKLFPDARLGILLGFVASEASLGVVEWLGTIDFSTLPTWLATSAGLAVGALVNTITAWRAKHTPAGAATGGNLR